MRLPEAIAQDNHLGARIGNYFDFNTATGEITAVCALGNAYVSLTGETQTYIMIAPPEYQYGDSEVDSKIETLVTNRLKAAFPELCRHVNSEWLATCSGWDGRVKAHFGCGDMQGLITYLNDQHSWSRAEIAALLQQYFAAEDATLHTETMEGTDDGHDEDHLGGLHP